ncbi:HofP DNA utilization family protein [Siccibacter turicensis]|uniref:HofP DNA utilization family protein n=1 Tax=Siccibacter turicensis TaxID=357233 RepID=UPI0039C903D8
MRVNYVAGLLICIPLWACGRDPFAMPGQGCQMPETAWLLKGVMIAGEHSVALLQHPDGIWQRVRAGDDLPGGVRVSAVNGYEVQASLQGACTQETLRWTYQGRKNEGNHAVVITTTPAHSGAGRPGKSGVPDGGRRAGGAGASGAGRK